jgi:predicted DNA-binding transcriptional regulator AlpA
MNKTNSSEPFSLESLLLQVESLFRQVVREETLAAIAQLTGGTAPSAHEKMRPTEAATEQTARNPLALTPVAVSQMASVPVQTLYNWRSQTLHGKPVGPRSFKMGRLVRYAEADVNAWIEGLQSR